MSRRGFASVPRRRFVKLLLLGAWSAGAAKSVIAASPLRVEVWKDPACGCCKEWMAHLRAAGFEVVAHDSGNQKARARARIAAQYASCHTAFVGGYALEGHVPVREIRRILAERPDAIGLAVPGMPVGSPGMEQDGRIEPYTVLLLHRDGGSSSYAKYRA
jgi:hypothetical protein